MRYDEAPEFVGPPMPINFNLVAIALGAAAVILVRFGFTQEQSAELMRNAWKVVQE
jgi:hypothetical protein